VNEEEKCCALLLDFAVIEIKKTYLTQPTNICTVALTLCYEDHITFRKI